MTGIKWVMNPLRTNTQWKRLTSFVTLILVLKCSLLALDQYARVVESLRTALAMGADEAIVINGENLDNLSNGKSSC